MFLFAVVVFPTHTSGYGYNSANQRVVYFPGSLMISHHSKAMVFHSETTLMNLQADLGTATYDSDLTLTTTCSELQERFFNSIIASTRAIQRVVNRLVSMQGTTNLMECDSYLRRFYRYATGLTPTMICPRVYLGSLKECKAWALSHCSGIPHHQRSWLKGRTKRSWFCHAGFFGLFRTIYESTGHSCEQNHVSHLKNSLWDTLSAMTETQSMLKILNGKTVILAKVTDALHTKVTSLLSSLKQMDSDLKQWKTSLTEQFGKHECYFHTYLEFFSKYSAEVNRVFASILRLIEIEDLVKQASVLPTKDLIGYKHLPNFMASEITMRSQSLSTMAFTNKALADGLPLLIQPMVDYAYDYRNHLQISILLTVPEITSDNDFCVLEYITPCFQDDTTIACPHSVLNNKFNPEWLGLPWAPSTKLSFPRLHTVALDCSDLHPLLHLGGRHYLSTTTTTLAVNGLANTSTVSLSPLMVYHFPCEVTFPEQQTGLGSCPSRLEITVPIFTPTHINYIPWHTAMDDFTLQLHYQSLHLPPPSSFNQSTLDSLDQTFHHHDDLLTQALARVKEDIQQIQETSSTTLNDVLTYVAFALAFFNTICFCVFFCRLNRA